MDKHKSFLKDEERQVFLYKSSDYANSLYIDTPYNEEFVKEVKSIGARWINKKWMINFEAKEEACSLIDKHFGSSLKDKYLAHKQSSIEGSCAATQCILGKENE